jgi:hypothetical protein
MMNQFNFNELNDYMFNNRNIYQLNNQFVCFNHLQRDSFNKKKNVNKGNFNNKHLDDKYFKPTEKDKLFWCFYIIVNDFNHYLLNKNNSFKIQNDFKIDLISNIKNTIDEFKIYKLKINDIENELISNNNISLNIINVFSIVYKKSIIILKNNIYYFFDYSNDNIIYIINNINNDFLLHLERNNEDIINNIKNTKLLVDYKKPIKSISFYKLKDLQNIAEKLCINILNDGKKKTKKILYEEILNIIEN